MFIAGTKLLIILGSNHECQNGDIYASKQNKNIIDTNTDINKQKNECSSDCTNCKLLNRLYVLLEEIVANRKKTKLTGKQKILKICKV